jgi:hypothetical protein
MEVGSGFPKAGRNQRTAAMTRVDKPQQCVKYKEQQAVDLPIRKRKCQAQQRDYREYRGRSRNWPRHNSVPRRCSDVKRAYGAPKRPLRPWSWNSWNSWNSRNSRGSAVRGRARRRAGVEMQSAGMQNDGPQELPSTGELPAVHTNGRCGEMGDNNPP